YYIDLLQHSSWYLGLTIFTCWIFNHIAAWKVATSLLALSVILEIAQYFIPDRSFSPHDLVMNFTGVLSGFLVVSLARHLRRQHSRTMTA
ncbi:MAG: VanZ family protein, partial [Chitinophagaceae bacterium]